MGLLLSQQKYVIDLLRKHNMLGSKPVSTPLAVDTSLTAHDGIALVKATMYRQMVGGLRHLRMIWPDIFFIVNKLSQFMHSPFENYWEEVKRLLVILMTRDPLVYDFLQTLLEHCMVYLMQTRLETPMSVPPQVLLLNSLVLIQSLGVLQINALLLVLPLSILLLWLLLLLPNCSG